ncbi:hypothetical protein DIE07_19995 [Burkholderia sp. Bp9002]|nr:hypothetical protein DIE07_19995 [Burkholderia sp. Bp9002]
MREVTMRRPDGRQKKRGRGGRVNTRRLLRTKETSNCEKKCSERPRADSGVRLQRSVPARVRLAACSIGGRRSTNMGETPSAGWRTRSYKEIP